MRVIKKKELKCLFCEISFSVIHANYIARLLFYSQLKNDRLCSIILFPLMVESEGQNMG